MISELSKYKIGSYEVLLDYHIDEGNYSTVYIGRCLDPDIIFKYNINKSKIINNTEIKNIVAIKALTNKKNNLIINNKIINNKIETEENTIMQFIKENPHDNIVTCYDIINDIDTVYIIMEYCEDGNLSNIIGKPLNEETIKHYIYQIVNGIKYMNENKIMHRDIKPKNLLLSNNKHTLKICDFGLSKIKTDNNDNVICGSPLYMAPEVFNNKYNRYDNSIDIWSLGIVMYEMIYGKNPLSKITDFSKLKLFMINTDKIILDSNINVSNECIKLLELLLIKDSEKRITIKKLYNHTWILNRNKSNVLIDFDNNQENNELNNSQNINDDSALLFKLDD